MKRTKFIAGALVLSMGLLGTGYAYWTDAIQINTTVKTGKLEVGFEKNGEAKLKTYVNDGGKKDEVMSGATLASFTVEAGVITLNVDNFYPGSEITIPYNVINESTIGVKPELTITVKDAEGNERKDISLHPQSLVRTDLKTGKVIGQFHSGYEMRPLKEALEYLYKPAYEENLGLFNSQFGYKEELWIIAEPGNSESLPQGETIQVVIQIDWKQHNAN